MKNLKKLVFIFVCLLLMVSFASVALGAAEPEKNTDSENVFLIVSGNFAYIPTTIAKMVNTKMAYVNGAGINFKLKDGTQVILSEYQLISTTIERCVQIRKELEARNYIFLE